MTVAVWERTLTAEADGRILVPLRFRVVPGLWPDIVLADAEGTASDIGAAAYELSFECDPGEMGWLLVDVGGYRVSFLGRTVAVEQREVVIPGAGPITVRLRIHRGEGKLLIDGLPAVFLRPASVDEVAVAAVTENVAGFRMRARPPAVGAIEAGPGVDVAGAKLVGLREPMSSMYETALAAAGGPAALFFSSERFTVFDDRVVDTGDEELALVPDARTIVSPIRVVEEFAWRDNDRGDMTRVVDRTELWRSSVEPGRFPRLSSAFQTVDAAFELAMETFQRNAGAEFALPGQEGLWSAGYFQGPGLGFGTWKRDTAHVALRAGSLLDPDTARASLAYVVASGFDNGADGDALPAVAIWDYVLATGDESLAYDVWDRILEASGALDRRFDESRGLVTAAQSTSNDSFDEPEAGGFALSTEIYAMQTYEAMSRMGALPGIQDARVPAWAERAAGMRATILEQYWNGEHGFFTSGPRGSASFADGYWETSGAEAALWGFLGTGAEARAGDVLRGLHRVAMSDFGVVLFPYRNDESHFTGSVWYCWQAGIARAAARVGDAGLIHRLIAQQTRTVVLNKTFYEVTDAVTGDSWRWPGQLWHAAGFASLVLFGLLGIRYDAEGLTFTPAVPRELDGTRIERLRYRSAVLDIAVRGHGTVCHVTLDGTPVERVPAGLTGRHSVVLAMR